MFASWMLVLLALLGMFNLDGHFTASAATISTSVVDGIVVPGTGSYGVILVHMQVFALTFIVMDVAAGIVIYLYTWHNTYPPSPGTVKFWKNSMIVVSVIGLCLLSLLVVSAVLLKVGHPKNSS